MMDVDCLFSPVNHISIAQLDKICLSGGLEVVTDKWGDADNIFILRSMQTWLEYRISHFSFCKLCRNHINTDPHNYIAI